jgi:hypothetical protein
MSPATTGYLRTALGLPSAPVVLNGIELVADYFVTVLCVDPSPWVQYLRGIDFHKPVTKCVLEAGHQLIRHTPPDPRPKPFLYFTDVGESPTRTGTNFPTVTFERYRVLFGISALRSYASSISFRPRDRISRPGGAVQYIMPTLQFKSLMRQQ